MAKLHFKESPTASQKKAFAPYLSEDEDLILVTGLSSAYMRSQFCIYLLFPGIIFGGLGYGLGVFFSLSSAYAILIGLVFATLIALMKSLHLYHSNTYLFTTRRVIIKRGVFSVKVTAALYDKITHIEVDQDFMDRFLLHHGRIVINTAGMNKEGGIVLKYVDYPLELKNLLERLINREREHLGSGTGPVSAVEGEIIPD
jgi:uncharacterized membrane protein YdbT with pleckstrin-like domain